LQYVTEPGNATRNCVERFREDVRAHAALMTVRVGNGGVPPGPLACLEVFAVFGTGP